MIITLYLVCLAACLRACLLFSGNVLSLQRQADVMIVAGTLTNKMAPALRKVRCVATYCQQHTAVKKGESPATPPPPLPLLIPHRCTIKCQNLGGSSPWEAVPTEEATTTTPTQWCGAVTGLSLWTSMSQAVLPLQRPFSMAFSSCRRRFEEAILLRCGTESNCANVIVEQCFDVYLVVYMSA